MTAKFGNFQPSQPLLWNKEGSGAAPDPNSCSPGLRGELPSHGQGQDKSSRTQAGPGEVLIGYQREKKLPKKACKALERSLKDLSVFS